MLRRIASLIVLISIGCGDATPEDPFAETGANAKANSSENEGSLPVQSEPIAEATADTEDADQPVSLGFDTFAQMCKAYTSGDADGWAAAQQKLIDLGDESVPALLSALKGGATHEREFAASLLAQTGAHDAGTREALSASLGDKSRVVRCNCAAALCGMGDTSDDVIAALKALLAEDDKDCRLMAIASVGNLGEIGKQFLPTLEKIAKDTTDDSVREIAQATIATLSPADNQTKVIPASATKK